MKYLLVIVLVICAIAFLSACSAIDAWQAQAQERARSLALDNEAKARAINERSTAAAGIAIATQTGVALQAIATQTGVAMQANTTQTAAAISANATHAANQYRATATARAQDFFVAATQTAVPFNANIAATQSNTTQARAWLGVFGIGITLALVLAMGLSVSAILQRESKMIRRDRSGQLPVILMGSTVTNPARQIGPATIAPRNDPLWHIQRVIEWARTGHLPELPAPQVTTTDGGASPELLLEAARLELQATTMAAAFQPGNDDHARKERIELIHRAGGANLLGQPTPPRTQVIGQGSQTVDVILGMIREQIEPSVESQSIVELAPRIEVPRIEAPPPSPINAVRIDSELSECAAQSNQDKLE